MVQVLPAVPNFGSQLAQVLSGVGSDVAEGFAERKTNQLINQILGQNQPVGGFTGGQMQQVPQQPGQQGQQLSPNQLISLATNKNPRVAKAAELALKHGEIYEKQALKERYNEQEKKDKIQNEIIQGYEAAQSSKHITDRMRELDKEGQPSNLPVFLSEVLDIPIALWAPEQAEEFQKIAAQKATKVAQAYGFGNVRAIEFAEFVKTIPSLLNTKEGRDRIYKTIDYFDNLAIERYNAYRDVLKENRNATAGELQLELTDRLKKPYEDLGQVLKYGDELVEVVSPEGKKGKVRKSELTEAEKEGYKVAGKK